MKKTGRAGPGGADLGLRQNENLRLARAIQCNPVRRGGRLKRTWLYPQKEK